MLTEPKEKEELIIYLAAAKDATSAVLMTKMDEKQMPVYFVSRALQERPEDDSPDTKMENEEELSDPWISFTDRSSCIDGFEAGLILTSPKGVKFTYALREKKKARAIRRKEGKYVVTDEVLYKRSFLGPWLHYVGPLQANYVLIEIHEGSCSMHAGPRSVVVKALRSGYYWPTMHADARKLIRECDDCQAHRTMIKSSNKETRFSLTYRTKAVIPIEIGMPNWRNAELDMIKNNEALKINLDLMEEKREKQQYMKQKSKAKMKKYYNDRVRNTSFRPRDLVYRSNEASHAKDEGKLGPKWEGPYEVTEALDKRAYKLRDRNGNVLL
uniref:Reverse transcriptase domain-containing protein n=1 Tax=Tanacetum cinerariifolium TaxID=118510 RepID=A0A699JQ91_TANCI|nr:reverse transcriptase domain-containing protein [Tanacetum cinerariifolium]